MLKTRKKIKFTHNPILRERSPFHPIYGYVIGIRLTLLSIPRFASTSVNCPSTCIMAVHLVQHRDLT